METISTFEVVTFVLFLLLSAFFSSGETALTAINSVKLQSLKDQNVQGADSLLKLMENPRKLITAMLIGNNICNVAASALATAVLLSVFSQMAFLNFATQMALVTGTMTVVLLIFGEITPKSIAIKDPVKYSLLIRRPVLFSVTVLAPVVWIFNTITVGISKALGIESRGVASLFSIEDLRALTTIGVQEGVIEKEEQDMIHSILDFSQTIVREIMTPRTDAVAIEVGSTVAETIQLINEKGHSRIPVYEEKIDNIMGVVYAKDLLMVDDKEQTSIRKYMRSVVFIPETKNVEVLLNQMKRARFHMAIVLDEYGGMSGLVTLEDIIEELIGEIQDEYDEDEAPEFRTLADKHYLVSASMSMDDFCEHVTCNFPTENQEFDTLGGFILDLLDRLPVRGEKITFENLEMTVKEIRKRRIITVEVLEHDPVLVDEEES